MEDSAKRKERLLSLRMEASAASQTSAPPPTASPLPHPTPFLPPPLQAAEASPRTPRFDYYTNPTGGFSGSKRKSAHHHSPSPNPPYARPNAGPRNYYMGGNPSPAHQSFVSAGAGNYYMGGKPSPAHQSHNYQFPDHSPFQAPPYPPPSSSWRGPIHCQTPLSGPCGTPPSGPSASNPCNTPVHGFYSNSSRGGSKSPNYDQGGSPMNYPAIRNSSNSYSGRGKGFSPRGSSGRGGGGRRPSVNNQSGSEEPEHHYGKSMVEDPWKSMQPIVGNILEPRSGSRAWLPESLTAKENKPERSASKLNSELSLAEYLDMSFNETVDET
ncbi:hypothetical protein ACMD2_03116 [Ananas comosus]|uniref:Uncharacterized protein n=1 Tax=Ananas comosus TaxID=4615 RepID=A0A199VET1_ANACO|nr:hypothetical protein ACMD2_03116 [Ananas comosus]